jgi:hypothetical protein
MSPVCLQCTIQAIRGLPARRSAPCGMRRDDRLVHLPPGPELRLQGLLQEDIGV